LNKLRRLVADMVRNFGHRVHDGTGSTVRLQAAPITPCDCDCDSHVLAKIYLAWKPSSTVSLTEYASSRLRALIDLVDLNNEQNRSQAWVAEESPITCRQSDLS
jgi:hypothetical protein